MTTHPTNLLMKYINMNLHMNRTFIQGIIYYVDNTMNTEPGIDIDTYSR